MKKRSFTIRAGLDQSPDFHRFCANIGKPPADGLMVLYRIASWFQSNGDYGVIRHPAPIVDAFSSTPGAADALKKEGWLKEHNGSLLLTGFCDVSTVRKALGRKLRRDILDDSVCAACGSTASLVIDHKVPVSRGGKSERSNLQVLCRPCNARKGTMTMEEFTPTIQATQ